MDPDETPPGPPPTRRPALSSAAVGELLGGKYWVRSVLGTGGMGVVVVGEHMTLGKRFALKLLRHGKSHEPAAVMRFEHEARTIASLGHPNICDVYDFGTLEDGRPFLVLEKLEGESLHARLARERALQPARALWVLLQVLAALGVAHEHGIVHRDIKPGNVFIARSGGGSETVKLLDFGVAKELGDLSLTTTGTVMGTPAYMAPEQARGENELDARADLYACGVLLYEMLSGAQPYRGENYNQTMAAILQGEYLPLSSVAPSAPPALEALTARAMAFDREQRFGSALEMQQAIMATGLVPLTLASLPPPAVSVDLLHEQAHTFRKLAAAFATFSHELDAATEDDVITQEEGMRLRRDLAELERWTRQMRTLLARVAFPQGEEGAPTIVVADKDK